MTPRLPESKAMRRFRAVATIVGGVAVVLALSAAVAGLLILSRGAFGP